MMWMVPLLTLLMTMYIIAFKEDSLVLIIFTMGIMLHPMVIIPISITINFISPFIKKYYFKNSCLTSRWKFSMISYFAIICGCQVYLTLMWEKLNSEYLEGTILKLYTFDQCNCNQNETYSCTLSEGEAPELNTIENYLLYYYYDLPYFLAGMISILVLWHFGEIYFDAAIPIYQFILGKEDHNLEINGIIYTFHDEINAFEVETYLKDRIYQYSIGTHFIVFCGLNTSNDGTLADTDLNLADDYQSMFDRLNNECQGPIFERQYKIGKIIPLHSEKNDTGNFLLSMQSKIDIKMLAEDVVMTKTPYILILASCYSHRSEVSNLLRSSGIYFDAAIPIYQLEEIELSSVLSISSPEESHYEQVNLTFETDDMSEINLENQQQSHCCLTENKKRKWLNHQSICLILSILYLIAIGLCPLMFPNGLFDHEKRDFRDL